MIKYETSVEEAKQIEELGFDFSKVCKDFYVDCDFDIEEGFSFGRCIARVAKTDSLNVYRRHTITSFLEPFRWEWGDGEIADIDDTDFRLNLETGTTIHTGAREGTIYEVIPIIPYPILEACLPDDNLKQFTFVRWTRDITECGYEISCDKDMGYGYEEVLHENFDQDVVKAFIWCVKNYPEETKKRFNEVMEAYK